MIGVIIFILIMLTVIIGGFSMLFMCHNKTKLVNEIIELKTEVDVLKRKLEVGADKKQQTYFAGTNGIASCVITKWNILDEKNGVRMTEIQLDNGRFISMPHEQMLSFLHFIQDDTNDK